MARLSRFRIFVPLLGFFLVGSPALAQVDTDTTAQSDVQEDPAMQDPAIQDPAMQDLPEMEPVPEPEMEAEPKLQEEPELQEEVREQGQVNAQGPPQMGGTTEFVPEESSADFQARLGAATSRDAYRRLARERLDLYEDEFERMHDRLGTLPENERAREAYALIKLRRQHDALTNRQVRMRRGDFDTARPDFTRDIAAFEEAFRRTQRGASSGSGVN